jgi:hypothetical protein
MSLARAAALCLAAVLLAVPAAGRAHHQPAQQPGCAGLNFTDPQGDSPRGETDLLEGFLAVRDGKVSYSVRLASLPEGKAPGYLGSSRYSLQYHSGGKSYYALAQVSEDSASFQQGPAGKPIQPSTGDLHRGTPALLTFDLPIPPASRIGKLRITAAPGAEVPDDDVATGTEQTAECAAAPAAGQPAATPAPPPARPAVRLRHWTRGFVVTVRPARRGRIQLLRDGRRVRSLTVTGAETRVRVPRRRGTYRARFEPQDPAGAAVTSRPLRVRR